MSIGVDLVIIIVQRPSGDTQPMRNIDPNFGEAERRRKQPSESRRHSKASVPKRCVGLCLYVERHEAVEELSLAVQVAREESLAFDRFTPMV